MQPVSMMASMFLWVSVLGTTIQDFMAKGWMALLTIGLSLLLSVLSPVVTGEISAASFLTPGQRRGDFNGLPGKLPLLGQFL